MNLKKLFRGLLCLIVGPILLWMSVREMALAWRSTSWPTVEGVVRSTEVKERRTRSRSGREKLHYEPVVRYEYRVKGVSYVARRVNYGGAGNSQYDAAVTTSRYPAGRAVTVHYDPKDPGEAVLEVGTHMTTWFWLVLSLFSLGWCVQSLRGVMND